MDIMMETGKQPLTEEMNRIYSEAQTRVTQEIRQYKEFAKEYLSTTTNDAERKALQRR